MRLALACLALAAMYFDPAWVRPRSEVAYSVVAGYAAYAAAVAITINLEVFEHRGPLIRHVFDIATCAALPFLVGPTSPLFVLFIFAIVSSVLKWGWRVASGTAIVLFSLYLAVYRPDAAAWDGIAVAPVLEVAPYLMIAGLMFAYVAAYRRHSRERLARLDAWPQPDVRAADGPSMTALLRHAALALRLDQVVAVWEDMSEPGWRVSHFSGRDGDTVWWRDRIERELVTDALANLAFTAPDPASSHVLTADGIRQFEGPLVAPGVFNLLRMRSFSCAPFEAAHFRGRVFVLDPRALNGALLAITENIASRIGIELEHFGLRRELELAAAARERARLGRDMHDSILQELTATRLQLASMSAATEGEARQAIDHAAKILAAQQQHIREFVVGANPRPVRPTVPLAEAIPPILDELANLWQCEIEGKFHPEGAVLGSGRLSQIRLILAEAVANAVRHGKATRIGVTIELDARLLIEIRDNGFAEAAPAGARSSGQIAPFSLGERVRDMGGGCELSLGSGGGTLMVALPGA
jgi:signal transduction histidine kinase